MKVDNMNRLLIVGAGGHGQVVADTARATRQWQEIAFVDLRYPELSHCGEWPVIGREPEDVREAFPFDDVLVAVGDNETRLRLIQRYTNAGHRIPTLVHPAAWVSPSARLAMGTVVFAQVAINHSAEVGVGGIINTSASIDHECVLGDAVHVSPGANLAGQVNVGNLSWIGIGASVRQCQTIGANVTVGAGAAVVSNVDDGLTVVGVPAKPA